MLPLTLFDAFLLLLVLGCGVLLLLRDWAESAETPPDRMPAAAPLGRAPAAPGAPGAPDVPAAPNVPAANAVPTVALAPAATAAPALPAPAVPSLADLLLVDDSAVARTKLRRLFEGAGYRVQLARDGVEALALLAQGRFAMMITDLEMPNMDGVTLIAHCLGQPATARMPIMAVSAHEDLRSKFGECGDICGVHRKPWVDDILLSHVAALIGAPAATAATAAPQPALAEH